MSGVPERLRNLSEREFYHVAVELRVEVLGIVASSVIPKSRRFTFAVPMAQTARDVVMEVVTADAFYPGSEENVAARKRHLTLAIAACEMLMQDAQAYIEVYRRRGEAVRKALVKQDKGGGSGTEADPYVFVPNTLLTLAAFYCEASGGDAYAYMPADGVPKTYATWADALPDMVRF